LDLVVDHLNTLNDLTPKIRCRGRDGVDPNLIFGVESKLFLQDGQATMVTHSDEVETVTVFKGPRRPDGHNHSSFNGDCNCGVTNGEHLSANGECKEAVEEQVLSSALNALPTEYIWRVKGFIRFTSGTHIVNWAFGRFELIRLHDGQTHINEPIILTVMGSRGEVKMWAYKLATALGAEII
jgi:hypothetical protein